MEEDGFQTMLSVKIYFIFYNLRQSITGKHFSSMKPFSSKKYYAITNAPQRQSGMNKDDVLLILIYLNSNKEKSALKADFPFWRLLTDGTKQSLNENNECICSKIDPPKRKVHN